MSQFNIHHFSFHKCLTSYFEQIMIRFTKKQCLRYKHFNSDKPAYIDAYLNHDFDAYSLNNHLVAIDESMRVTRFTRDPRDLIVSGYYYHCWTDEAWCRDQSIAFHGLANDPLYREYIDQSGLWPINKSYQEVISSLTKKQGFILEMLWREPHFKLMRSWPEQGQSQFVLRYEDIIDNEESTFAAMFDHYCFPEEWRDDWLSIVTSLSRRNQKLGKRRHTRSGDARQWENEFDSEMVDLFNKRNSETLRLAGYS